MSEVEVPIESTEERINEAAEKAGQGWISGVALYSALLAAMAAVTAMLAGHHSDHAMIEQIRASDQWGYYQAKGIKAAILASKLHLLNSGGKELAEKDLNKTERYKADQENISEQAKELEAKAERHLALHSQLARSVTFFQVGIAVAAISVLTRRRRYWFVSMGFALVGIIFFAVALAQGALGL
ncbi:MAG: hypothetical protein C5B49_03705 [Bdellovibrio sp.]|nr:MAG: hypothetical protein C5B49_03705 [Bdellovibrio sp.]